MPEIPTAHLEPPKVHPIGKGDTQMARTGLISLEIGLASRMWQVVVVQLETIGRLVGLRLETECSSS